ncbi:hypothetical protein R1flu_021102 [Riccia fluitans]|uniref:Uncharacterized protein n=1 Tax=Riccia fluitans TaxID=41844 RepID=A0ABD1ZRU3_9MARC
MDASSSKVGCSSYETKNDGGERVGDIEKNERSTQKNGRGRKMETGTHKGGKVLNELSRLFFGARQRPAPRGPPSFPTPTASTI